MVLQQRRRISRVRRLTGLVPVPLVPDLTARDILGHRRGGQTRSRGFSTADKRRRPTAPYRYCPCNLNTSRKSWLLEYSRIRYNSLD